MFVDRKETLYCICILFCPHSVLISVCDISHVTLPTSYKVQSIGILPKNTKIYVAQP